MLITVLDGDGNPQVICVPSQGVATDRSTTIAVTDTAQTLAPSNAIRSGMFFQNRGNSPMLVNELGTAESPEAFQISPGGTWPPNNYPVPVGALSVAGAAGDPYVFREW